ncbi:MAG: hypothetical protein Wins2KO_06530 [Winogradskyella sp.]
MEINLERIKNRFDGKVTYGEITEIGNQYKKIHSIIPFKIGLEETIIKHFKCLFNKRICDDQIGKLQMEKRGYDNELRLLGRDSFDTLRQSRKLDSFLRTLDENTLNDLNIMGVVRSEEVSDIRLERFKEQRDNHSRNYNKLNLEGNVSMGSNSDVWR